MTILNHIFQISPVILAIIAAIMCSLKISSGRRRTDRQVLVLAIVASILMIVAQTSWWSTYLIENSLQGTWFANLIWTTLNNLVMIIFILMARSIR